MHLIWLCTTLVLGLILVFMPRIAPAADGFEPIFDGSSLEGWHGKPPFWSVRDGTITGQTTAADPTDRNTFLIFREPMSDFELRLQVRILSGNSGIQFRSIDMGDFTIHGYQTDIDSTEKYLGDLYEEGGRGILAKGGQKVEIGEDGRKIVLGKVTDPHLIAVAVHWHDWNDYRLVVQGRHILQEINGLTTVDFLDNDPIKFRSSGLIALQLHAGPPMLVQFKNLRLKKIP
jgi:Domain of Unknown Function (DUF1080)